MHEDVAEVLLDETAIAARVAELAGRIMADYTGCEIVLLTALKGAVVFLADLMRSLDMPVCPDFVLASSYGDSPESSGDVQLRLAGCGDLAGKHVLIVEDIIDTGRTLKALVEVVHSRGAASVKTCCLLDKPSRRVVEIKPDYVGFEIPDHFVVGYGLDYSQRYRNLPYVGVLRPEVYETVEADPE